MAIYDLNFNRQIITDVVLNHKEELTLVNTNFNKPYSAIVINNDDFAFCKVLYDKQSLSFF